MSGCFLAIGECMVEMAPDGAGRYAMGFAGDSFNTAWYIRRHLPPDATVAYLTAVGTDETSRRMVEFMRSAGITPEAREIPDRTVGLYLIQLTRGERSFSYWRETSAARRLADGLVRLPCVAGPGDVAYLSGITLAILPPDGREALLGCLQAARRAGVTVAFDPNMRPRLWPGAAAMRDWVERGAGAADIVLPSFEEEASHFGDASPEATIARYRGLGAATVVVKDGGRPVHAADASGQPLRVDLQPAAELVDTTAAGDSFNAALLAALMRGEGLPDAIAAGCKLAAQVVARRGALVETT